MKHNLMNHSRNEVVYSSNFRFNVSVKSLILQMTMCVYYSGVFMVFMHNLSSYMSRTSTLLRFDKASKMTSC